MFFPNGAVQNEVPSRLHVPRGPVQAAPGLRATYGAQKTRTPFDRLNVAAVQKTRASRYQAW